VALIAQDIPKVGLVMDAVKVVRWFKNVGDSVTLGEPLVEVETEKSVVEIEATVSGRLAEILVPADHTAAVGDRLAWIESDQVQLAVASSGERIRSSPVARKLAAERGVDLGAIAGSGPAGRVQLDDVRRALDVRAGDLASPLSPMRRALARAMTLSNATIPQFTVERSVDWTQLQAVRAELSASLPAGAARLSVNDFLLQGVARALLEFPVLNATFSGDPASPDAGVATANGAHIGLVVALDDGLLVPVFHDVERLGLAELARQRVDRVQRALQGRLKREETDGATFSISNLGAHGPDRFSAIINPPQSAILAVGRQRDCVVAMGSGVAVRPQSALTLTVDHRIADGRLASEFLARLVAVLEGRDWRLD
jgi:pyruvate dehydrogenase E2 component (dihydrolipoamide acetyltransferase)